MGNQKSMTNKDGNKNSPAKYLMVIQMSLDDSMLIISSFIVDGVIWSTIDTLEGYVDLFTCVF